MEVYACSSHAKDSQMPYSSPNSQRPHAVARRLKTKRKRSPTPVGDSSNAFVLVLSPLMHPAISWNWDGYGLCGVTTAMPPIIALNPPTSAISQIYSFGFFLEFLLHAMRFNYLGTNRLRGQEAGGLQNGAEFKYKGRPKNRNIDLSWIVRVSVLAKKHFFIRLVGSRTFISSENRSKLCS